MRGFPYGVGGAGSCLEYKGLVVRVTFHFRFSTFRRMPILPLLSMQLPCAVRGDARQEQFCGRIGRMMGTDRALCGHICLRYHGAIHWEAIAERPT